jgi:hypothetical protein
VFRLSDNFKLISRIKKGEERKQWVCEKCNVSLIEEHNNKQCHQCEDWYGCGEDCTLSKLTCPVCKDERIIP